jgi:hypothetical protein
MMVSNCGLLRELKAEGSIPIHVNKTAEWNCKLANCVRYTSLADDLEG